MQNKIILFLFIIGCICTCHCSGAQTGVESTSKIITRNIPCSSKDAIVIVGDKAAIRITGWDRDFIQLKMIFSAVHGDKKLAAAEVEYMQYSITRDKNSIELRNAFVLPPSAEYIHSKLDVSIEMMIPKNNYLVLKNAYGNVSLTSLSGKIDADMKFCNSTISNLHGEFILQSSYTEVRGVDIETSSFKSQDNNSRFIMSLGKGHYQFTSKYSDLDLTTNNIAGLKINAIRTAVTLQPHHIGSYQYNLYNKQGEINVPAKYASQIKKQGNQSSLLIKTISPKPIIQISTTSKNVTIK